MRKQITIIVVIALLINITPLTVLGLEKNVTVTLPNFEIRLNGIKIDNEGGRYPLIIYKNNNAINSWKAL